MKGYIFTEVDRPSDEIISAFESIMVATAYECNDGTGLMDHGIKPVLANIHAVGPAVTCMLSSGDNLTLHKALDLAQPGDILVVNGGGNISAALWGGNMTNCAIEKGIRGIVIDGAIRDVSEIRKLGFPACARSVHPGRATKSNMGSINIPIECGGVIVEPGDLAILDDDGVVIIAASNIQNVLEKSLKRTAFEINLIEKFKQGKTTWELFDLEKNLQDQNIVEHTTTFQSWMELRKKNNNE